MAIDAPVPLPEPPLTLAEGAGLLAELSETLSLVERGMARAVDLVGRLQRAGVVEHLEGLPLELLLALQHRLTSADRRMLLEAARVLDRLPVTRRLFAEQKLSWGQVRGAVARLRRVPVDDLAEIDARVEASLEHIDAYSPDELVWAVERAADELDGARKLERREQRRVAANFLAVLPCLDGAISLYGELDPVAGATVLNALDAASDPVLRQTLAPARPPPGLGAAPRPPNRGAHHHPKRKNLALPPPRHALVSATSTAAPTTTTGAASRPVADLG